MNINFELLSKQKLSLLHVIDTLEPTSELKNDLDGILLLIDGIEDEQEEKSPITDYLINFIERWEDATDEQREFQKLEYDNFLKAYKLPELSADDLLSDIKNNKLTISK
jgi:hypothetical protein